MNKHILPAACQTCGTATAEPQQSCSVCIPGVTTLPLDGREVIEELSRWGQGLSRDRAIKPPGQPDAASKAPEKPAPRPVVIVVDGDDGSWVMPGEWLEMTFPAGVVDIRITGLVRGLRVEAFPAPGKES